MATPLDRSRRNPQAGNAVTLTLLGLAVAILAGVAVLYWIGRSTPTVAPPSNQPLPVTATSTPDDPRAGWQRYTDEVYAFTLQYPPGWVVATGTVGDDPVITVAPGTLNASSSDVYHLGGTRVSVYPLGHAEERYEQEHQSTVIVEVPQAVARDLLLSSKRPWATIARFSERPEAWGTDGYVFARAAIEEELVTYYRGSAEVPADSFDPAQGDFAVRQGFVDPAVRSTQELILSSFRFAAPEVVEDTGALPTIETPQKDTVVVSPLTIRGTAPGPWYFEGSFPVRLETSLGEVLAEVPAPAQGEWMTEGEVPFELNLVFSTTTATSGVLIFSNDNPSGMPELQREYRVPVLF